MRKQDIVFVIFGSTGDLTARKLLPSLSKLYEENMVSKNIKVVAIGRRPYDTKTYLEEISKMTDVTLNVGVLSQIVEYYHMQITEHSEYAKLKTYIDSMSNENTQQLYYFALSPKLFVSVSENLHKANLIEKNNPNQKIIFEKPFGFDLPSAKHINKTLWNYFDESQIYRIDHYLGKEMIQNIMTMRFANVIFEQVWNKNVIKRVTILAKEKSGILNRALYYDDAGAIKDMLQSHLLQVLALVAMETPKSYSSSDVKDAKVNVLKNLSFDKNSLLLGQYDGYLEENNIKNTSKTETFVFLKAFVHTKRFKKVPFYLITGKKLNKKESKIIIEFKPTKEQKKWHLPLSTNKLCINIDPKDGISVSFNSKVPTLREQIKQVELEYLSASHAVGNKVKAYERLLQDAINGSKTLFTRWDEIELLWKFTDKIKKEKKELFVYKNSKELLEKIEHITKESFNEVL